MLRKTSLVVATVVDIIHLTFMLANSLITYYVYVYTTTGRGLEMMYICFGGMLLVAVLQAALGRCPLTILSEWLRRQYDPDFEMKQGFIQHYAKAVFAIELSAQQVSVIIIGITGMPTLVFCVLYILHVSTH